MRCDRRNRKSELAMCCHTWIEKGLSAAVLKNTALALMLINHFSIGWYYYVGLRSYEFWDYQLYLTRPAFYLFAFLIAEGMVYTKSRTKYMLRLLAAGLISEVFFDWLAGGMIPYWESQNVFFTLFLGTLAICLTEKCKSYPIWAVLIAVTISAVSFFARVDYGCMGIVVILLFYYLRDRKTAMFICVGIGAFVLQFAQNWLYSPKMSADVLYALDSAVVEAHGILSFPLILLYNGKRGRQFPKLFYYAFYPIHLAFIMITVRLVVRIIGNT